MTARVPAGHFWVPGPREWWLIVFYAGLAACVVAGRHLVSARWWWAAIKAWCGIGFGVAWLSTFRSGQLDCTFVAVGHGCGVVVELPSGKVLVSDAGRLGQPQLGAREISQYLWSRGLTHIDAIVISHNDTDHFNAVPELLERFSVGAVYVSPVMFNRDTGALRVLKEAILRRTLPCGKRRSEIGWSPATIQRSKFSIRRRKAWDRRKMPTASCWKSHWPGGESC